MSTEKFNYIGIDDTDNLETRGTGFRARQLLELLQEKNLARGLAVTRHQLLVDDRVPYTSHNSCACIVIERLEHVGDRDLMDCCRSFLLEIAAPGSDVGLCFTNYDQAVRVTEFGHKARTEFVEQDEARSVAQTHGIALEGLSGDHQGIIGALAATGLHVDGNDGRYIWPRVLHEYSKQTLSVADVLKDMGIDKISLLDGSKINNPEARIRPGEWARAVRIDHKAVLLVEETGVQHEYKVLEKETIKSLHP